MSAAALAGLRPHQVAAVNAFEAARAGGARRLVVELPTGAGKTRTAAALVRRLGVRTLWLAHTRELVQQARVALRAALPVTTDVGGLGSADVVVTTIQTAGRRALADLGTFGLVIVDEVHHAVGATYRKLLGALGLFQAGGPVFLGLTATPGRPGLADLFEKIVYQLPVADALAAGILCPIERPLRLRLAALDVGRVLVAAGDLQARALGAALVASGAARATAEVVARHAPGRRTMVFTATIAQATATAARLNELGIPAAAVSAVTPTAERADILTRYAAGSLRAVVNCALLTEGYDCPATDCVVVARPTKSEILYRQMIGRGLRPCPGKSGLLIVDLVGAVDRHDIWSVGRLIQGRAPVEIQADASGSLGLLSRAASWLWGILT